MNKLFAELKRRNVIRVAGVYAVVGWLLAQVSTTLEEALGLPAWFDAVIVALLLIGLPIALVLAWAFELTPEGVVRTENVPEGASITPDTGRKLDYTIVAGLVLLGAMIIWQQLSHAPQVSAAAGAGVATGPTTPAPEAASIAVLPFADLSPGGDQEYFSDGIAEEILNVLVGVKGLDIVSRTSSFQFKGRDLGIPEIAGLLKVRHVVEGSVRKSGEAIRITAQLIDASNDKHLWSNTYDRPLTAENIFAIQDEIANSIVTALSEALGLSELAAVAVGTSTHNLSAYELFLQARPLFHARARLDEADGLLERAIQQDPGFVKALEMRAALQTLMVEYGFSDEDMEHAERQSDEFSQRVLAIEPQSSAALAVLGKNAATAVEDRRGTKSYKELVEMFDHALQIDPRNTSALNWRGLRYLMLGRMDDALADFASCRAIEPYYLPCVENYISTLGDMGRDEESLQAWREALNIGATKIFNADLPVLARLGEELAFKLVTNDEQILGGWSRHEELYNAYRHPELDHSELIESIRSHMSANKNKEAGSFPFIVLPIGEIWEHPDSVNMWDKSTAWYRKTDAFKSYMRDTGVFDYWREFGFPQQCRPRGADDFVCD